MKIRKHLPVGVQIALGFLAAILAGAFLLWLPISTVGTYRLSPLQALFESTSAVCVTGLIVVDTGTTFTVFGKIVLAVLIQIGGMGIAILSAVVLLLAGREFSINARKLMRDSWNLDSVSGMVTLLKRVLAITFGT